MSTAAGVDLRARYTGVICLAITAVGWGLNWPAIKVLLRELPPLFSRGIVGIAASLILAAVAYRRGENLLVPRRYIGRLFLASLTNVFAWMGFSTLSMRWLTVSEGALLVYTMPIWVTVFAWPMLGHRPSLKGCASLLLGIAGISVLLGAHGLSIDAHKAAGVGFALAAAILFALGTVLNRNPLPIPPIALVAWQVGLGCLPMTIYGLLFENPSLRSLDSIGWAVLGYMTIVPMALCYLMWFAALRSLPAATASTGMLMVPIIGTVSAALLIGEQLRSSEVAAMALTLSGVALALRSK